MASEGAKNFRPKPYSDRGRRSERRRSFLGIVKDKVKGLFKSSWLEQPLNTDTVQEEKRNHIQQQPGNNTSNVESNLGQSYLQPQCSSAALPGPSKLLPQLSVGLASSSGPGSGMPRLDRQGSANRQDAVTFSSDIPFGKFDDESTSLIVNGGDDRSEFSDCSVSTSGCSSMAGNQDKDFQQEASHLPKPGLQKPDFGVSLGNKRGERSFLWSYSMSKPANKSAITHKTTQLSTRSKTPSFNVSVFGSPLSKSVTARSGHSDSHFYSGKTIYGGASSQKKRKLHETSPQLTPNKRRVHAKPVSSSGSGVKSKSAKKILSVLERLSTPLQDAKKVPSFDSYLADSPLSFTPSRFASSARIRTLPYRGSTSLIKGPPVHALMTPGNVYVAKNYQTSLRQKDSAQIKTDPPPKSIGQLQPSTSAHSYVDTAAGGGSQPGKVKQQRSQHYSSRKDEDEVVAAPALPTEFTLPMSAVPKFTFGQTASSSQQSSVSQMKSAGSDGIYTFSTPIPQSKPEPAVSCSVQNFEFSSPITVVTAPSSATYNAATSSSSTDSKNKMSNSKPDLSFKFNPTTAKSKADNSNQGLKNEAPPSTEGIFKPAEQLKMGSVMDVLRPKTSESVSSNTNTGLSVSSELKKDDKKETISVPSSKLNGGEQADVKKPSLSEVFKMPSNMWECPTCMIRNKQDCSKCVACETAKPGATRKAEPVPAAPQQEFPFDKSWAQKFKRPEGVWECDTCMVNNKSTATQCIACETPKPGPRKITNFITPGGFDSAPLTSSASSNQLGHSLEKDKKDAESTSNFKFGAQLNSNENSASTKTDDTSKSEPPKTGGFKFGQSLDSSSVSPASSASGGFSFGQSLASNSNKMESGFTGGFKFGTAAASGNPKKDEGTSVVGGFKFGQSTCSFGTSKPSENSTQQPASGITLGTSSAGTKTNSSGATLKTDDTASGIFKFGSGSTPTESAAKTQASSAASLTTTSMAAGSSGVSNNTSENVSGAEVKPVFKFGSGDKKEGTSSSTAAPSLFTFGKVSNATNCPVLGVPQKTDNQTGVQSASSGNDVGTFGAMTKSQDAKPAETTFIFGQTTQPSSAGFTFGSQPQQPTAAVTVASQPSQPPASAAFGVPTSQPALNTAFGSQPAVNSAFGIQSTQSVANLAFGTQPTQAATGSSVLGQSTQAAANTGFGAQTATTTAAPAFTFGSAAAAASTNGPSATPAFNFSAKPNDKPGITTTASSEFNLAGVTSASTTSASSSGLFDFTGSKQESPMSAQPVLPSSSPFQFDQNATPSGSLYNMPVTSTTIFGQPTSTTSTLGTFGSQPTSAPTFGGFAKSASTPAFGSTVKPADSSAPAFGSPAPAFGSTTPTPSFGSAANAPAFGATTSTPAFGTPGQQSKPAVVFGSNTPTPSFQFGSQQPTATQPSVGGVFQFGQNAQQPAAPSTGFNFGAAVAGPAATNAAAPLNFGSGTTANATFTGAANPAAPNFQFNAMPPAATNNPFSLTTPASSRRVKTARRKLPRK